MKFETDSGNYITLNFCEQRSRLPTFARNIRGHHRAFREEEVLQGFQGEVSVQILDFPIHLHFNREKSASLGRLFFPKSPSRMTPGHGVVRHG